MTQSHLVAKWILFKCKICFNDSLVFDHGLTNLLPHLINESMVFISYQISMFYLTQQSFYIKHQKLAFMSTSYFFGQGYYMHSLIKYISYLLGPSYYD